MLTIWKFLQTFSRALTAFLFVFKRSVFFACFREHTFTLTMRNGASGRRRASRLSTGTSKTETSSDVQRDATGLTAEKVRDGRMEKVDPPADIPGFDLSSLGKGDVRAGGGRAGFVPPPDPPNPALPSSHRQ